MWQALSDAPEKELVWINDPKLGVTIASKDGCVWRVPGRDGVFATPSTWAPLMGGIPTRPQKDLLLYAADLHRAAPTNLANVDGKDTSTPSSII